MSWTSVFSPLDVVHTMSLGISSFWELRLFIITSTFRYFDEYRQSVWTDLWLIFYSKSSLFLICKVLPLFPRSGPLYLPAYSSCTRFNYRGYTSFGCLFWNVANTASRVPCTISQGVFTVTTYWQTFCNSNMGTIAWFSYSSGARSSDQDLSCRNENYDPLSSSKPWFYLSGYWNSTSRWSKTQLSLRQLSYSTGGSGSAWKVGLLKVHAT